MKWLLWKEYRHNRLIVLTAAVLLLLPYLVTLCLACLAMVRHWPVNAADWKTWIATASLYSIGLSVAGLALIGGNAIAGERVDRSAEFLFALPIPRWKSLSSKLLLALIVLSVPWLVNLPILASLLRSIPRDVDLTRILTTAIAYGCTAFCVAFVVGTFVSSTSFATLAGLVGPLIVTFSIGCVAWRLNLGGERDELVMFSWHTLCPLLAALSFLVGTWQYLRRVEP